MQETRYGQDALISLKEHIGHLSCGNLTPFIVLYYSMKVFFQTSNMREFPEAIFCYVLQFVFSNTTPRSEPYRSTKQSGCGQGSLFLYFSLLPSLFQQYHLYFNNISQLCFSLGAGLFSSTANKKIPPGVQKDGHKQPQANII